MLQQTHAIWAVARNSRHERFTTNYQQSISEGTYNSTLAIRVSQNGKAKANITLVRLWRYLLPTVLQKWGI